MDDSTLGRTGEPSQSQTEPKSSAAEANPDIRSLELALRVLRQLSDAPEPQIGDPVEISLALVKIKEYLEIAQAAGSSDAPDFEEMCVHKPKLLHFTTGLLWNKFETSRRAEDLDLCIEFEYLVLQQTPEDHLDRAEWLSSLGVSYQYRFDQLGYLEDLDKAVAFQAKAVLLAPVCHPDKPAWLNNLGNSYQSLFEQLGSLDDLHKSVHCIEQAALLTPNGHPDKPAMLNNLGNSYQHLSQQLGRLDDLHKSVNCKEQAVLLTPDGHPDKPARLNNLGSSYKCLFQQLGRLDDIHKSVHCIEQAVLLTPDGHPNKPGMLNNLGNSYLSLFWQLGSLDDLHKSVHCIEKAVLLTPDGHHDQPGRLNNLGTSYQSLFEQLGSLDDLHKSAHCIEQAVLLAPDGHPDKPGMLGNLGNSYQSLFEQLGRLDDIHKSVSCKEQAVLLTPDGHTDKPGRLSNLGNSYLSLFEQLGRLDDIHKSVHCVGQAVLLTPDGHSNKPGRLGNLGNSYQFLFEQLGSLDDLHKSVNFKEQAVLLTPDGHPGKPRRLSSLGNSYKYLFEQLGRLDDIHKSVNYQEQAVLLTPDGHPDKPGWLNNLGALYQSLFEQSGNLQYASQAISCLKGALMSAPANHPNQNLCSNQLGIISWFMFTHSKLPEYALHAMNCFKHAALITSGLPSERLRSSHLWALLVRQFDLSPLEAYTHCMVLLPEVVWLGASVTDRYERLAREVGVLTSEAATAAISLNCYDLALEWLEQGRSVVWGQTLQLRTPYDELHAVHPELAEELQYVSHEFDLLGAATAGGREPSYEVTWRHRWLSQRREELLAHARRLPRLENFLRPPKASEIMSWVQGRTTVIVNVHKLGCDALVVQAGTQAITHVPLTTFSARKAENARDELASCLLEYGIRRGFKKGDVAHKPAFTNILAMLWFDVVKPVLDRLGIIHPLPVDDLPHITWCTTGSLSFLPLHAAGDFNNPSTVLHNLAISSYTPTISSLKQHTPPPETFSGVLAVGHASAVPTRWLSPLPGTKDELDRMQELAKGLSFTRLDEESARTDAVLQAMKDHSWVHFACHGSQNRTNPMKSALHLHDGDLDLETISRHPLKNAQLAFLSACQTATGDSALPDESIHLAAGLIMAGYPTVIATMWSISDKHAPLVAEKFYECLLEGGVPDSRKAAKALHVAVACLRETVGVDEFAWWVPYIHIGR